MEELERTQDQHSDMDSPCAVEGIDLKDGPAMSQGSQKQVNGAFAMGVNEKAIEIEAPQAVLPNSVFEVEIKTPPTGNRYDILVGDFFGPLTCEPKFTLALVTDMDDDEPLQLFFSNDGGASYYNAGTPRLAYPRNPGDEIFTRRLTTAGCGTCLADGAHCGTENVWGTKTGCASDPSLCCSGVSATTGLIFVKCHIFLNMLSISSS